MRTAIILVSCGLATSLFASSCAEKPAPSSFSDTTDIAEIRRGNGGEPGSLDPALAEDVHAFNVLTDLYEGLVNVSADGSLVPGVAESWKISADGLTYAFTIRRNSLWSNGKPVVATDFVRALRRVADPQTGSTYGFLLEAIQNFKDVQSGSMPVEQLAVVAINDRLLEIRLQSPTPYFLAALSMPTAFPVYMPTPQSKVSTTPDYFVGNGAYTLDSLVPGGAIRATRSSTYWDADSVAVEEVVYLPIIDPVAELNMYRAGELEITHTIPPTHVEILKNDLPDHVRIAPSLAFYYLAFDLTEAPLDNRLLRQSLNMAIDRQQLVAIIGRGEQPAFGVVPPGVAKHNGSSFAWRDLQASERHRQAKELYRRAGYSDNNPLAIQLTYIAGDFHVRVALAVSSMWQNILGIDVTLRKMEWQYFLDTRDNRAEWQVMQFSWFGDYDDASTFMNIFRSEDVQNLAAYENPDYDELLAEAGITTGEQRRAEIMANAESVLLEDYPIAPLYFYVSKHMVKPEIAGFHNNVLDRHPSKYLSKRRLD